MEKGAKFIINNYPDLFNGESNDLIVPLSSQKANFQWDISSNDQFHVGSSKNPDVKPEIMSLINAKPF
jgi:hypothetical protein